MIHIAICDDNSYYHEILKHKINNYMNEKSIIDYDIACFTELDSFYSFYKANKVDIVFLDIMINEKNSMNLTLNTLNLRNTQVIFMTAYPEAAYNISETHCCYFLIKSKMNDIYLTRAINRAINNLSPSQESTIIIKGIDKNHVVNTQDITFVESFKNNVIFHLIDNNAITVYASLKSYEESLPDNFLRCHKSYLINTQHVTGFRPYKFILDSGNEIPLPIKKYTHIVNQYTKYINSFKEVQ